MQYKGFRIDVGIYPDLNPGHRTFYAKYTIRDGSGREVFVGVTASNFTTVAECELEADRLARRWVDEQG